MDYIKGTFVYQEGLLSVFEVNNIGYKVFMASSEELIVDQIYLIYVTEIKSEYKSELYGFSQKHIRERFEQFITIKGIGPKTAYTILLNADISAIDHALEHRDVAFFTNFPKVGEKTANLFFNLKVVGKNEQDNSVIFNGLLNLGFKKAQITQVYSLIDKNQSEPDQLKQCLQLIIKKT